MKIKLWVTIFFWVSCISLQAGENHPAFSKKHVLILNSYSKGYFWTDNEVEGIENGFRVRKDIVLKIEYMDAKLINTPDYYEKLSQLFAQKYKNHAFDVIISTDDDALNFLKKYRDELFPQTPVVFCGVNCFTPSKVEGFSLYTGVNEEADFKSNIELILQLHPATQNIYVINDNMTTAQLLKEEFMKHTRPFTGKVEFVFFENIVMEELKERLERLSSDSVVFYLSFFMDAAGHSFWPSEAIPQITQASPVPVYGAVDYLLGDEGYGIVGGRVKSSEYQGQIAARLAMEILDGKNVTEIPVVMESPNRYMFDYEQCLKFDIRIADLPTPRQMINEPESFYYKHKRKILTVIAIFGAMIIYIVILLFNIKKRIRAQRGLQTIIDSAASIVDYQSLEKFKEQLLEQLTKLLKIKKTVQFYKINTETEKDHSTFNFLPVDMPDEKNKRGTLSQQEKSLLLQSIKEGKCVISKNKGVAFLKSAYLPGNLVYFESSSRFDAIDRDLLEIFSNNISMSIENIEKFKIEESLKTARHIQMSMLPKAFSKFSGKYALDLHAYLCPAKEVGGDFYDFFSIDDDHVCFTLGDVSGKGVPAALFMAMTKSLIRVVAENNCDAGDIMSRSNNYLARDNEQAMFVTVFLAILNYKTGELTYANAGHNPPYMVSSNGNVKLLKTKHGIAMGVFENAGYIFETITLQPGDGLFVYSDGITEAKNPANEMFGNKRLEKTLKQYGPGPSQSMNTEITKSLQTFVNGAQQSDDITMLFVRMKKKEDSGG